MQKKLFALLALLALTLAWGGTALAADGGHHAELGHTGRIMLVVGGDVEVAADEQADAVLVVGGTARIEGTVNSLLVVDGVADVRDGTLETLAVVNGTARLAGETAIGGDLLHFGSSIERADGVEVAGRVRDMAGDLAAFGVFIGAAAITLWIGFGLATLLAGLLVAGLAARQVRHATRLIGREPGMTLLTGILAVVVPPILAAIAIVTIIGIPAGVGLLVVVWPAAAFVGYIVAAIWLGEWLLSRRAGAVPAERPYAAAVVGLLAAFVVGLVPIAAAILSIFGLGAVVLAAVRTLGGRGTPEPSLRTEPIAA